MIKASSYAYCPNPTLSVSPSSFTCANLGTNTVTLTITDSDLKTASCPATVIVLDNIAPVITTCPVTRSIIGCNTAAITGPSYSTTSASTTYTIFSNATNQGVATDNCGIGSLIVSYIDAAIGNCPTTVTRTWTISDASGNNATCNQTITVNDITGPTITCPASIASQMADNGKTYATLSLAAPVTSDGCGGAVTLSWTMTVPTAGTGTGVIPAAFHFNIGTTTITYTATDACGNDTGCSFSIEVMPNYPPVISCPVALSVSTDNNVCTATLSPIDPKITFGTAPISLSWQMEKPLGTVIGSGNGSIVNYVFGTGTTRITWTATNVAGFSTCTQDVTVTDNQPPTFTAPTLAAGYCVENIIQAEYNPGYENDPIWDLKYIRPEYFLFRASTGSIIFDLTNISDICCGAVNTIRWEIDFEGTDLTEPTVSGTGQPSTYPTDIKIWGDGVNFTTRTHVIRYWVKDCNNNENALPVERNIIVNPRPKIAKNF